MKPAKPQLSPDQPGMNDYDWPDDPSDNGMKPSLRPGPHPGPLHLSVWSGAMSEREYAYSRVVRHGDLIEVAGTTSLGGDAYVQATAIFSKVNVSCTS